MDSKEQTQIENDLACQIAEEMSGTTGTWMADIEYDRPIIRLKNSPNVSLGCRLLWNNKDRIEINGCFPNGLSGFLPYDKEKTEITVSRTKPINKIANDIKKRLLPSYLKMLKCAEEGKKADDDYKAKRLDALQKIADACNGELRDEGSEPLVHRYDPDIDAKYWSLEKNIKLKVRVSVDMAVKICRMIMEKGEQSKEA